MLAGRDRAGTGRRLHVDLTTIPEKPGLSTTVDIGAEALGVPWPGRTAKRTTGMKRACSFHACPCNQRPLPQGTPRGECFLARCLPAQAATLCIASTSSLPACLGLRLTATKRATQTLQHLHKAGWQERSRCHPPFIAALQASSRPSVRRCRRSWTAWAASLARRRSRGAPSSSARWGEWRGLATSRHALRPGCTLIGVRWPSSKPCPVTCLDGPRRQVSRANNP